MFCKAIIKFGPNKGNECNCKIKDNNSNYCGKHKNYSNKNIEKKNENKNKINQNKDQKTNETIGNSLEKAWCDVSKIECGFEEHRYNQEYVNKFKPKTEEFLKKYPELKTIEHIGSGNGSIDHIIQNNKTLSLKTLKKYDGKICPQNIGQPSYTSFDKIWNLDYKGNYEYNSLRFDFIKKNIIKFLNEMLKNLFCCDYEIIGINCEKNIKIEILKKPTNINYFDNIDESNIIFTRTEYEEKWNEKKQKKSEFSTIIKLNNISVGELQFHKSSRKVIKFRFYSTFLR